MSTRRFALRPSAVSLLAAGWYSAPPESRAGEPLALTPAQALLRKVVESLGIELRLECLFAFCASRPLSRSLLLEWRAGMEALSPSTINVRLSAARKLVGEARRNDMG
jgi:hypothetical protein